MPIETDERPLITFALFAYNQEKYIREAVKGALAQTYSPLEIILSDDCSTDSTFQIIQEAVRGYEGNACISINRNASNLGLIRHVEKVLRQAKGELIVVAAGDDVSESRRVDFLAIEWLTRGKPSALCSRYALIDKRGDTLSQSSLETPDCRLQSLVEQMSLMGNYMIHGATAAWTPDLVKEFPEIGVSCAEDAVLSFRAGMRNGICSIDEILVRYRIHESGIWSRESSDKSHELSQIRMMQSNWEQHARDLAWGCDLGWIDPDLAQKCKNLCDANAAITAFMNHMHWEPELARKRLFKIIDSLDWRIAKRKGGILLFVERTRRKLRQWLHCKWFH